MIPFTIINLDKPRKLRFGMGAMIEFEKTTGIKLMSIGEEIAMETFAQLLWVMLKQEDKELTLDKTCELIDEYAENVSCVIASVSEALQTAFASEDGPKNGLTPKK